MRPLTAVVTTCLGAALLVGPASADDDTRGLPSRQEVRSAQDAVATGERDVAAVQADLAAAARQLDDAGARAARAAEAFNGARYRAGLARDEAVAATTELGEARAEVDRLREVYGHAVISSYTAGSDLLAFGAAVEADGLSDLLDSLSTARLGTETLEAQRGELDTAVERADDAARVADEALADAQAKAEDARVARDEAQAAADDAADLAASLQARREELVSELAQLQNVSVALAERRQTGLEERAARAQAEAMEVEEEADMEVEEVGHDRLETPTEVEEVGHDRLETPTEVEEVGHDRLETPAAPTPTPTPDPEPSPAAGADAAIAFARAQLGEPYRWGAAGPDSWDCSGLTLGAWAQGGRSLPHYSVAQYEQSTPVSLTSLQPGDLVFWGDSESPSSIYHVALYVGDGMIVHAPRTGRPVVEESLYYWIPPNFAARP